jgi:hypothetical protein
MKKEKKETIKCLTPKFRVSFPNVFVPKAIQEGQEPFYSIQMLFPKTFDNDVDKEAFLNMKRAVQKAIVNKWGSDKAKWPQNMRLPFRDGTEKEGWEGYGSEVIFVNAKSKMKPGIVDQRRKDIDNSEDFYAGCYARATLTTYAYSKMGNVGVAFGLQNLQFMKDGEPFSGKVKASDDFEVVEGVEEMSDELTQNFEDLGGDF